MKKRKPTRKHKHAPFQHIRPMSPDRVEKLLYGETLPNQHHQQRLEEKRKGTLIMPSLQDALQTAMQQQAQANLHATINEWSEDDQPQTKEKTMPNPNPVTNYVKQPDGKIRFVETVGVARAVFDYVLNNGGKTRLEIRQALMAQGYKKGSVDSLMTQNVRAGNFTQTGDNKLYCIVKEYKPVPSGSAQKKIREELKRTKMKTKLKAVKEKVSAKATAPRPNSIELIPPTKEGIAALKVDSGVLGASVFDPKGLLNTLSVIQARALYDELKKIFGG